MKPDEHRKRPGSRRADDWHEGLRHQWGPTLSNDLAELVNRVADVVLGDAAPATVWVVTEGSNYNLDALPPVGVYLDQGVAEAVRDALGLGYACNRAVVSVATDPAADVARVLAEYVGS